MPLNAENKRVARALDSLDEPIIRRCVDGQSLADDLDRLVVRRINFQGFSPEDLAQPCAWVNAHGMATRFFFGALFMLPSFGKLVKSSSNSVLSCLISPNSLSGSSP